MIFPFEAQPEEVMANPDPFVDAVFSSLASEFLVMPKGEGFLDYPVFAVGYEALKKASDGFTRFECPAILSATLECPVVLIVLRTIIGFTPPEWAYIASSRKGVDIPQNAARTLDRSIRSKPNQVLKPGGTTLARIAALVETACDLIAAGCPDVPTDKLHRFNKADSLEGLSSVQQLAGLGAPYAMLLYERFLRLREHKSDYQVIACLAGRGFGVRREDMRQMIVHTKGKVFTPKTLDRLVDYSALSHFRTKKG